MQLCFCKTKICDWQFMSPCVTHNTVYIQTLALSVIGRIGVIRASPLSLLWHSWEQTLSHFSLARFSKQNPNDPDNGGQPFSSMQTPSSFVSPFDFFAHQVKNWFWIRMCKIYSATSFQGRRLKRFFDLGLGRGYSGAQVGNFKTIY